MSQLNCYLFVPAAVGSVAGVWARRWQCLAANEDLCLGMTHISMTSGRNEGLELRRCSFGASSLREERGRGRSYRENELAHRHDMQPGPKYSSLFVI